MYPPGSRKQALAQLVLCLDELSAWVDAIKPIAQPMRYGNKAFRLWHARLVAEGARMCRSMLGGAAAAASATCSSPHGGGGEGEGRVVDCCAAALPETRGGGSSDCADGGGASPAAAAARLRGAEVELLAYFLDSFGNATRIDYGTGHETTFMILICACVRANLVRASERKGGGGARARASGGCA